MKIWDFQAALIRWEPFSSNFLIQKVSYLKAVPRAASAKPTVISSEVKKILARQKTPRVTSKKNYPCLPFDDGSAR